MYPYYIPYCYRKEQLVRRLPRITVDNSTAVYSIGIKSFSPSVSCEEFLRLVFLLILGKYKRDEVKGQTPSQEKRPTYLIQTDELEQGLGSALRTSFHILPSSYHPSSSYTDHCINSLSSSSSSIALAYHYNRSIATMLKRIVTSAPRITSRGFATSIRPAILPHSHIAIPSSTAPRRSYHEKDKSLFAHKIISPLIPLPLLDHYRFTSW